MKAKPKILILDDNKLFCALLDSLIGQVFLLNFANSEFELCQLTRTENYNLVILRICESILKSRRLINHIRESQKNKDVPVIAIISRIRSKTLKRIIELGIYDVLIKPFNVQSFMNKIDLVLNYK